jgi:serine/threonine protein kinase
MINDLLSSDTNCSSSSDQSCSIDNNLNLHGCILGDYNILYNIGSGAYSLVWLAYHIGTNKYYALKVQDPRDFKDGYDEVKFVSKLPKDPACFNNIIEYFVETKGQSKYLCSVWNLHACDLDTIIRKNGYENGLPLNIANKIIKQLMTAIDILHNKFKVYHGDIKPDNIFLKGNNSKNIFIIKQYDNADFPNKYANAKKNFWLNSGKNIKTIDKMKKCDKLQIRKEIHADIMKTIVTDNIKMDKIELTLDNCNISLGDFGTYCTEDNYFEDTFGTRYYQAPEIILGGNCSYPVDIWAFGCTYFELLTGTILFDPIKDAHYSRDYYHLLLMQDTCGHFTKDFLKTTKQYKKFFNNKFKLVDYKDPIENRLVRKLHECNIQITNNIKCFLHNCLALNPLTRHTITKLKNLIID